MSTAQASVPIGEATLIHRTASVLTAEIDKQIVMMDVESGRYLGLDDIGSVIWQRLETPRTFGELIDGCVADVRGTSYQTVDDLLYYCRCVAGSIGRLSLGIFGTRHGPNPTAQAAELADSLGVALQLTNILRDIREDHQNGRIYLPAEDLAKFDCDPDRLGRSMQPGFARLVEFEAERARDWYATGWKLLGLLDRRSAACTGAMAGIYRRLLERIAAEPAAVLRGRMSLSGREKATVALKALTGRFE